MKSVYKKIGQRLGLSAAILMVSTLTNAADFVMYPHPMHLAKKLPATISMDDTVTVDENTVRLLSIKIKPSLLNTAKSEIENLASQVDATFSGTSNEFERVAKMQKIKDTLRAEAEAADLNKTYLFEFESMPVNMSPEKLCVSAPTNSAVSHYYQGVNWPVNKYRFYSAGKNEFEFYCAKSLEEAQKFEEKMAATEYRRVNVQVYARPLQGIYEKESGGPHLYFVPYLVKVSNPKNQSVIFEIKR